MSCMLFTCCLFRARPPGSYLAGSRELAVYLRIYWGGVFWEKNKKRTRVRYCLPLPSTPSFAKTKRRSLRPRPTPSNWEEESVRKVKSLVFLYLNFLFFILILYQIFYKFSSSYLCLVIVYMVSRSSTGTFT